MMVINPHHPTPSPNLATKWKSSGRPNAQSASSHGSAVRFGGWIFPPTSPGSNMHRNKESDAIFTRCPPLVIDRRSTRWLFLHRHNHRHLLDLAVAARQETHSSTQFSPAAP
ncbi:hypothetical protein RP20_CCG010372 [Aedes albopictus]|nr:hypothetical protein RP20_CCG010372 [Aedes albopictus]